MKKIFISILVLLLTTTLVLAEDITVLNTSYSPSPFESVFGPYSTGSQITANIQVNTNNSIKRTYLSWDSSWVDCTWKLNKDYQCILTVTPFMNTLTDVYVNSVDNVTTMNMLLGTYDFKGQSFPVHNYNPFVPQTRDCHKETVCSRYKKECSYEPVCVRYEKEYTKTCRRYDSYGNCRSYRRTFEYTDNCLRFRNKRVCEFTDECIRTRTKRICR